MSLNWLWFIPILLIMVVLHELGHFLTARYFGMKVHEFGIGFPPKVWSKKTKDGMEWSINALPIGGFVRIEGENGDSDDPNAFGKKPTWQRAIVLAAGPAMNILLAFVLYYLVTIIGGTDNLSGPVAVNSVMPNSPAAQAGLQPGDTFITVNNKPVKTSSDITIETALDKNNPVQLVMGRNGSQYNVSILPRKNPPEGEGALGITMGNKVGSDKLELAGTSALNKLLGLQGADAFQDHDKLISIDGQTFSDNIAVAQYIANTQKDSLKVTLERNGQQITRDIPVMVQVDNVFNNSSASSQKLPLGALITRIDDTPIHNVNEYQQYISSHQGQQMTLYYKTVSSANSTVSISDEKSLVLLSNTSLDPKAENRAPRVTNYSFTLNRPITHIGYNPVEAAGEAWNQTTFAIGLIPRTFKGLFDGSVSVSNLAGPIGMAQITDTVVARSAADGFWNLLKTLAVLMAMLSVNLGVVNILPLPALDGGRLIFVLIEMVTRGKRVPPEKESLVHLVGMVALLSLMLLISWQDILRLITGSSFQ